MSRPIIISIDDQDEVRNALLKDLEAFESHFEIYDCESAADAEDLLNECERMGQDIALIISDHVMPEENGVDFLSRVFKDGRFGSTRKLLLTGLASHGDTIRAINEARIDHYISKPWDKEDLCGTVRNLITHHLFDLGQDLTSYGPHVDPEVAMKRSR